jgi:hypothetical protein
LAEWLLEHGIGEDRAMLVDGDEVLAAKLRWPGEFHAGAVVAATLTHKTANARRGTAVDEAGREILLDRIAPDVTEGSTITVEITRAAIAERGRFKRANGRVSAGDHQAMRDAPFADGKVVRSLPTGIWEEVWDAAWEGDVAFPGGSLLFSVTPAMTLVDIDGDGTPRELALAAIPALARSLQQFDLGGSIGIDFPTISDKAGRKAVDEALGVALEGWPHERTAMNGFGFVQLVARLEGPSLLHRMASSRVGMAARMALRRAEMVGEPGAILLTVHPALKAKLKPEWLAELARRTGREVRIATDPGLALNGAFAQAVPL